MKRDFVKGLYYITHIENIPSILEYGIYSHAMVQSKKIPYTQVYDSQIVNRRYVTHTPDGQSLWNFANLYFQPRNPMLYRVVHEKDKKHIAVLGVRPDVLDLGGVYVTTGNAASSPSLILPAKAGIPEVYKLWKVIMNEWWKEENGSKRIIMAECLVPGFIPPDYIHSIYVVDQKSVEKVSKMYDTRRVPAIAEPSMFFQPSLKIKLREHLSLVEGDLFFSQMQTLTISVNTVGVMGKGLASRAKYQFPDMYVFYEDLCKKRILQMGKPYIYKRETYLDTELADEPFSFQNPNSKKWFLLFPTKQHWRQNSTIDSIEKGLQWLKGAYSQEKIESIAIPALGCGLGGLDWKDVGPLMCHYLSRIEIPVSIYLPREQKIDPEWLSAQFLLKSHG